MLTGVLVIIINKWDQDKHPSAVYQLHNVLYLDIMIYCSVIQRIEVLTHAKICCILRRSVLKEQHCINLYIIQEIDGDEDLRNERMRNDSACVMGLCWGQ